MLLAAACALAAAAPDQTKDQQDSPDVVRMNAEQQKNVGLATARAERRQITEPVRVAGAVAFDEGHFATLRPLAQARVMRLLVQPGDRVQAGQPLALLDVPSLVAAQNGLASAHASLKEAQSGVAVARDSLRRGEILARDGSLARAEAERRRLELAAADAAAEAARTRVAELETEVRRLDPSEAPGEAVIASPISGAVVSVGVTPGEAVDASTEAFTVADLSVVVVLAQVPEASAALVAVGDPASVRLGSGGARAWAGKVAALSAALDPQARTLPVRIRLDNADGALRSGMFVEVTLTADRGRDGVVVPAAAVQLVGDKHVAFTPAGDGRFRSRELTVGVERPDWVEVREGLSAGDEVVTAGSFALKAVLQKALLDAAG